MNSFLKLVISHVNYVVLNKSSIHTILKKTTITYKEFFANILFTLHEGKY